MKRLLALWRNRHLQPKTAFSRLTPVQSDSPALTRSERCHVGRERLLPGLVMGLFTCGRPMGTTKPLRMVVSTM
jgi:hypothetical protein